MKASAQPIAKLNTVISDDGRSAKFTVVVRTGQSLAFTAQYEFIGTLIQSLQNTARTMRDRLLGSGGQEAATYIPEALTRPAAVSGVAFARDCETGDTLLWIETAESGSFPLRLNEDAVATLRDAFREHEAARHTNVEVLHHAPVAKAG